MICGFLMVFDGFFYVFFNVFFEGGIEGCNFIVPKNCLRSGAPIL